MGENTENLNEKLRINAEHILDDLAELRDKCEEAKTCKGCRFNKKHIGCEFRGKTPREWKI